MSNSGISEIPREGFRLARSQYKPVDSCDIASIRESNHDPTRNGAMDIEISGLDDTEKRHESKANIDNHFSVALPTVIMAIFTLAALTICFEIVGSLASAKASYTSASLIGHGGSFTQPQAKILDLIASVIMAPLIVGLFNFYCFKSARASAVNEKSGLVHSLSLRALVEVSTTDWGSYSPFKLFELARVKQARIVLLAILTLASAISFSALSNFVAYEAFSQEAGMSSNVTLQYLYRKPGNTIYDSTGMTHSQMPLLSTTEQIAEFSSQWFQVLTALSYSPAGPFLDHDAYIGINVTKASLARLPSETTNLLAVPAYKLTYDCHPVTPIMAGLTVLGSLDQTLSIDVSFYVNSTMTMMYLAQIYNGASTILSADNGVYQFLAFQGLFGPTASVMLGNIGSFNTSNSTTMTSFGPVPHYAFNNTLSSFSSSSSGSLGTKSVLSVWGINCTLTRQQGTVHMNRKVDTTAADWKSSPFTPLPSPQDKKEPLSLITSDLQVSPRFVSPVGTIPGLGGALAASSNTTSAALNSPTDYEDIDTWAKNFLYAEGEARRIAYEIALEKSALDTDDSRLAYTVAAQSWILKYRMVYIPWILIIGLSALVVAGMLALGLEIVGGRRIGKMRVLTPLRVVADMGAGLEMEWLEAEHADDEEIETWAKKMKVRYVRSGNAGGGEGVRLKVE